MNFQRFIPHPNAHVRDPRTNLLVPLDGVTIGLVGEPADLFWERRRLDGDGVIVAESQAQPEQDD